MFTNAAAGEHGGGKAGGGGGQEKTEGVGGGGEEGRGKRARRVHGRAGDRSGEHGFETNHRAYSDAGGDSFFLRASGDVQDGEHQQEGEDKFEDEGLKVGAGRYSGSEELALGKKEAKQDAGGERASGLAEDVGSDGAGRKASSHPKADGDRWVQMRSGDVAHRVNHSEHDQAKGESDAGMGDRAPARRVDHDSPSPREHEGKRSKGFGHAFLHRRGLTMKVV